MFVAVDRPFTDDARIRCAVWSVRGGTLSGAGAAYWHRMIDRAPRTIEITAPRTGSARAAPGIRLRRRTLDPRDAVVIRRILVTPTPLTALEAGVEIGSHVLDRALQKGLDIRLVRAAQDRNRGRTGSRDAERLLRAAENGTRSEAERLFRSLLRAAGITGYVVNHVYGRFVLDFAFPSAMVCIEIDGWAFHSDATAFQRDRERQNELSREWTVLRYTWRDLTDRPDQVVAEVRHFVDRVQ